MKSVDAQDDRDFRNTGICWRTGKSLDKNIDYNGKSHIFERKAFINKYSYMLDRDEGRDYHGLVAPTLKSAEEDYSKHSEAMKILAEVMFENKHVLGIKDPRYDLAFENITKTIMIGCFFVEYKKYADFIYEGAGNIIDSDGGISSVIAKRSTPGKGIIVDDFASFLVTANKTFFHYINKDLGSLPKCRYFQAYKNCITFNSYYIDCDIPQKLIDCITGIETTKLHCIMLSINFEKENDNIRFHLPLFYNTSREVKSIADRFGIPVMDSGLTVDWIKDYINQVVSEKPGKLYTPIRSLCVNH